MEFCVCCGAVIPEGRMVCRTCELKYWWVEDGIQIQSGTEIEIPGGNDEEQW